jgi:hypothetical protein
MQQITATGGALLATLAVAGATLAVAAPAQAATGLTATDTRIGEHPAFVRAVVDFAHGTLARPSEMLAATDPEPFADGVARVSLSQRGVRSRARIARARGVTVRVIQATNRITVRLAASPHRFKYVAYLALPHPQRLVIDLWKSAPPVAAAEVDRAADGCLALTRYRLSRGHVAAAGTERNLFEHSFVVRLRAGDGRVLAQRPTTSAAGRWSRSFRYPAVRRQAGTLEAVAASAKDGALDCIVQVKVTLGASPDPDRMVDAPPGLGLGRAGRARPHRSARHREHRLLVPAG